MASLISSRVLELLIKSKKDTEEIRVAVIDPTGHMYAGRIADFFNSSCPDLPPHCTIEADDGELVWRVELEQLRAVDIRPRRHPITDETWTPERLVNALVAGGTTNLSDGEESL